MKQPVFYTKIRPAEGQREDEVIKIAHNLGYELMPFNGYTDADIGYAGNRGPKYAESRENLTRCIEIQNAAVKHFENGDDWPHIIHTA